jgi:hypothetical protein
VRVKIWLTGNSPDTIKEEEVRGQLGPCEVLGQIKRFQTMFFFDMTHFIYQFKLIAGVVTVLKSTCKQLILVKKKKYLYHQCEINKRKEIK